MTTEEEWIDVTKLGSIYEEQTARYSARHRHRIKAIQHPGYEFQIEYPWQDGLAPSETPKPATMTNDDLIAQMKEFNDLLPRSDKADVGVWIDDFGIMLDRIDDITARAGRLGLRRCVVTLQAAKDRIMQPVEILTRLKGGGVDDDVS